MDLSPPLNTKAEVLSALITNGSVSMKSFSWMEGFRTRISELIKKHSLPPDKLEFALDVYEKINK